MRFLLIATSVLSFSIISCAQDQDIATKDVPSVVTNAFKMQFTDASDVEWEQSDANYEVEFTQGQKEYNALLDAQGNMVMYKHEIGQEELPKAVMETISANYNGQKIDETEKLTRGNATYYQVEFDGISPSEFLFSEDGQETKEITYWD